MDAISLYILIYDGVAEKANIHIQKLVYTHIEFSNCYNRLLLCSTFFFFFFSLIAANNLQLGNKTILTLLSLQGFAVFIWSGVCKRYGQPRKSQI